MVGPGRNIQMGRMYFCVAVFRLRGIATRVVQRWDYDAEAVSWADAVFTAGGDGTFLLAASKVRDKHKPVIGINTDPDR